MSTGRLGAGDTAIQPTILDAKGDLIVATAADTPARLAVGSANQVLTVDSSTATGLKWATAAAGGKVLQVVTAVKSDTFTSSTANTYVDVTGLSASITPSSTSSKVLVIVNIGAFDATDVTVMGLQLVRGSTAIGLGDSAGSRWQTTAGIINAAANRSQSVTMINLDSPSTTSATTYKVQLRGNVGGTSMYINRSATDTDNTTYWRAASTITLLEIGA